MVVSRDAAVQEASLLASARTVKRAASVAALVSRKEATAQLSTAQLATSEGVEAETKEPGEQEPTAGVPSAPQ